MSTNIASGNSVSSVMGGSQSLLRYWTTLGFGPDSTGEQNRIALNKALTDRRYVKIVTPGVYNFDDTIWIPSNTTLEVCAGVTFKKEIGSVYSHIIGNKGILTNTSNTNIKVYGNGLTLDINGIDTYSAVDTSVSPLPRLRSLFEFWKVSDFIIDNIYVDNMEMEDQFFMTFSFCTDGAISNIEQVTYKNQIMFGGGCKRITATNIQLSGQDDDYFIGIGYPNACVAYGDVEDITITNHISNDPTGVDAAGYIARIWRGAWSDWVSGMTTHDQESVVASNGRVYARGWNEGGDKVSTIEPSHTDIFSPYQTGADGVGWWLMETEETVYSSSVKRVKFVNTTELSDSKGIFQTWHNYVTAGQEDVNKIDDIEIDNLVLPINCTRFIIEQQGVVNNLTLKNSTLNTWASAVSRGILSQPLGQVSKLAKFIVDNCTITLPSSVSFVYNKSTGGIISELDILNSNVNTLKSFVDNAGTGTTFGRLVITDSTITATGIRPISYGDNQLLGDNTLFTRVKFIGAERLLYMNLGAGTIATQRYVDCEFETLLTYIAVVTLAGCNLSVIMTGTKFIDPGQFLFYCNQSAASNSLNISVSGSSGTVTAAKVRSGVGVVVTACDLAYV